MEAIKCLFGCKRHMACANKKPMRLWGMWPAHAQQMAGMECENCAGWIFTATLVSVLCQAGQIQLDSACLIVLCCIVS
eukprot:1147416-Pelagomonas_calceolata.AAC.12